jgi:hypothetical protein
MMAFLDQVCLNNNIEYFIGFGTLLGAVRDHKIIPWDDDIDLFITSENLTLLKKTNLAPYHLDFRDHIWRFNSASSEYPYIDLFEIKKVGENYVFVEDENRRRWRDEKYHIKLSEIYPLKSYSLGDLNLPGPSGAHSLLTRFLSNPVQNHYLGASI